jgi:hypothetical protein
MKYLSSFTERLNPDTYYKASTKLSNLGHEKRSKALKDWGDVSQKREDYRKLKLYQNEYSKYGSFKMYISDGSNKILEGNFYIKPSFDTDWTWDTLLDEKSRGFKHPNIIIDLEFLPADDETVKLVDDFYHNEGVDNTGNNWLYDYIYGYRMYFSRMYIQCNLEDSTTKVTNGDYTIETYKKEIKVKSLVFEDKGEKYDEDNRRATFYGFKFSDRTEAVKFRNRVFNSLNDKDGWGIDPNHEVGNWNVPFANRIDRFLTEFNKEVLESEPFKFNYDTFTKSIRSASINSLYSR